MNEYQIQYEWVKGETYSTRIKQFLNDIDDFMIPPLSIRVNIDEYAKKLACMADTLFIRYENEDIASCSIYCNMESAYISSIAVKKEFANMHIGTRMMLKVQEKCRLSGCIGIKLNVSKKNNVAILYYEKCGFHMIAEDEEWLSMEWR